MTDKSIQPGDATGGLSAAFDWRAGRTWAAFIGSALAVGCALSVTLGIVTVLILDLPSGKVSESGWFIRTLLMFLFFVPLVVFLRHMARRTPQAATPGMEGSTVSSVSAWVGLGLDILLHALWFVLAFSTCAALFRLAGPSYNLFETDRTGMFAALVTVGLILQDMPALLHRWAKPKAQPAPSTRGQTGGGEERRP